MKIVIAGDIGSCDENIDRFMRGDAQGLYDNDILKVFTQADVSIANLEKPITDKVTPLGLCAPDFHMPVRAVEGLLPLRLTAVTLANNHIMDMQVQGMLSTIKTLTRNAIRFVGAGESLKEANQTIFITSDNMTIGVYACAEHEFSIADEKHAGANPFDPMYSLDHIEAAKRECDYLIVLYHGGLQNYPYPTPMQQRVCRRMCDKGADLVVCQHSHCIGCMETYQQSTIIYGQGNFLLDTVEECWKHGLLVTVELMEKIRPKVSFIPFHYENGMVVHDKDSSELDAFFYRTTEMKDQTKINQLFSLYCKKKEADYLANISACPYIVYRILRKLRLTKITNLLYGNAKRKRLFNYLSCETHHEVLSNIVNPYTEGH